MRLNKNIWINILVLLSYYGLYLYLLNDVSGGDLFLLILFVVSVAIHLFVLLIIYYRKRAELGSSMLGLLIGIAIMIASFLFINKKKEMKRPEVEIGR